MRERLSGESDFEAQQLVGQIDAAREALPRECEPARVLSQLCDLSKAGRHMSRADDPEVMSRWYAADLSLAAPCLASRWRAADCVYRTLVLEPSSHWINGPKSYQPSAGHVIEVWQPRAQPMPPAGLPTLSDRVLDAHYKLVEIRTVYPTDEARSAAGKTGVEHLKFHLKVASDHLEILTEKLRESGL